MKPLEGTIQPPLPGAVQKVCTECGKLFTGTKASRTCSGACRTKRSRRFQREPNGPEYNIAATPVTEVMNRAAEAAMEDLPAVMREVLAEECRPHVREALSGDVLQTIGDMMALLPAAQRALEEQLSASAQVFDIEGMPLLNEDGDPVYAADFDQRLKAVQLVLKYTIGQPGLAPQPELPEQAPITILFPEGMAPHLLGPVDGEAEAHEILELGAGENQCDTCGKVKALDEFVAGSNRCFRCHALSRERVEAEIQERTKGHNPDA